MSKSPPVLLLGLFDTAIATARCFKKTGIVVYGTDYQTNHLGFSSSSIISFKCCDPKENENEWLHFLIDWLIKKGGNVVLIPVSDEFAVLCSKNADTLLKYSKFLLPSFECMENINDRSLQFDEVKKLGVNVPNYKMGPVKDYLNLKQFFNLPFAIKPVNSIEWKKHFSNKGYLIEKIEQGKVTLELVNQNKANYLIQDIIEGDSVNNYEINSLYLPNGVLCQHSIQKLRQYPDRFGTATCIKNVSNPEIEKLAEDIIKKMNFIGFTNMEFKFNTKDNMYYYIETNTRVWLQVNFSMKIGINFPLMYYDYLVGNPEKKTASIKHNKKWVDFIPDLYYWIKYRRKNNLSLIKLLISWKGVCATNLFSFRDPLPFFKELRVGSRLNKILKSGK